MSRFANHMLKKIFICMVMICMMLFMTSERVEAINFAGNHHNYFYRKMYNSKTLIRAPSLFRSDEIDYHKYAAVLATTEPYRKICLERLKESLHPIHYFISKLLGRDLMNLALSLRFDIPEINDALNRYSEKVESTLSAYGMSSNKFNEMSSKLDNIPYMKKRVLLQAYFYKIVSDLEANLLPTLPQVPSIMEGPTKTQPASQESYKVDQTKFDSGNTNHVKKGTMWKKSIENPTVKNNHQQSQDIDERFARALEEIEETRVNIREKIKRELNIQRLPDRIADPELLPAMCPLIQQASREFPKIASEIVKKHQLHIEDFNTLQRKLQESPFYRWKINRKLRAAVSADTKLKLNYQYSDSQSRNSQQFQGQVDSAYPDESPPVQIQDQESEEELEEQQ